MNDFNWEVLKRGGAFNDGRHRPKLNVAASGRMQISKQAYQSMGEPIYVKVFYDASQRAIALEPHDTEVENSYKVSHNRTTAFSVATIGLQLRMKLGVYEYPEELQGGTLSIFVRGNDNG